MDFNTRPISIRQGKIFIDGVEAADSVGKGGKIFDVGSCRQRAPRTRTFEHEGVCARARGVNCRAHSRASAADYYYFFHIFALIKSDLPFRARK